VSLLPVGAVDTDLGLNFYDPRVTCNVQSYLRHWQARGPKVTGNIKVSIDIDPQSFF
jgi:primosomal protein N'